MKKIVISLFSVFFVLVMAVSIFLQPNEHYSMKQAYGTWYGIHESQKLLISFYRLNEDGTFVIDFATFEKDKKCKLKSKHTEMGVWGLDESTFFTITQKHKFKGKIESRNPNNPVFYSAFKVMKLDKNNFIFAKKKPWLRKSPRFSRFRMFHAFRTKDVAKRSFEANFSEKWSDCPNISQMWPIS